MTACYKSVIFFDVMSLLHLRIEKLCIKLWTPSHLRCNQYSLSLNSGSYKLREIRIGQITFCIVELEFTGLNLIK